LKIRLFPDGGIHSAYLDLVRSPPNGVKFVGDFRYDVSTSYNFSYKNHVISILDTLGLPYLIPFDSDCFVHSCQKLIYTKADFVVDIEHGNPFMGSTNVFKHRNSGFRYLVKKIISKDNCKFILPWTEKAKVAFYENFSFLGKDLLDKKTRVVYPCVTPVAIGLRKFDKFTFLFTGGASFYVKGGYQVLEAFKTITDTGLFDCELIVVGDIPERVWNNYKDLKGITVINRLSREVMLQTISRSHCVLLPSYADTYGMFLIEAKTFGVPAIVVDCFAAAEIVTDGKTGFVIPSDKSVNMWFDQHGCKRMSKDEFRSQFDSYVPSDLHVSDLVYAMNQVYNSNLKKIGDLCIKETIDGWCSIKERDKRLKEVYQ
jgi:glycosyltransferase involved in cell wall biosynthesis